MTKLMDTQEVLKQYISEELLNGSLQVNAEDDLLGNDLVDSMGIMRLIAFIEKKYEIKIPLEDVTIENFITVQAINTYLTKVRTV